MENKSNIKRKLSRALTVLLILAIVVFLTCLFLKWFWVSSIGVSGISMMPNFNGNKEGHDVVWVNKTIAPSRGDVVVFYTHSVNDKFLGEFARPDDVRYEKYIKRVVAVGGDSIWWEKVSDDENDTRCVLKIKTADGTVITENDGDNVYYRYRQQALFYTTSGGDLSTVPYFQQPVSTQFNFYEADSEATAMVIPQGEMFVMGDNRFASEDSRVLGTIPVKNLYGVVINP